MQKTEKTEAFDFGFKDRFGRDVGCELSTGHNEHGHWFNIQSTRNGKRYGATNLSTPNFTTADERDQAAKKAVERSRKSQAKTHAQKDETRA